VPKENNDRHEAGKRDEGREDEEQLDGTEDDELVCAPKALTKPERVQILAIAHQRPISPSEFAREHGKDVSKIAYDFRVLRDKGYIELAEKIPVRGTVKHMYRATKRGFVDDAEWRLYNAAIKAGFREATLKDFVARAAEAIAAGTFDAKDNSNFSWKAIWLDEEGWIAFVKVLKRAYDEVMEIEADSAERAAKTGAVLFAATFAVAGFLSPEPKAGEEEDEEPKKKPPKKKGKGKDDTGKKGRGKGKGGKGKKS